MEQELFANMGPTTLIKRFETAEETVNVCVFLASNWASAVAGAAALVDGGVVRSVI